MLYEKPASVHHLKLNLTILILKTPKVWFIIIEHPYLFCSHFSTLVVISLDIAISS